MSYHEIEMGFKAQLKCADCDFIAVVDSLTEAEDKARTHIGEPGDSNYSTNGHHTVMMTQCHAFGRNL